jgi:uncharacterized protein (TIGR02246 family)
MPDSEQRSAVEATIRAFYTAFDEGFVRPPDFAADDWVHINPFGGIDLGLEATLRTVRAVHEGMLKGVTDTPETIQIRLVTPEVAIGTVTSTMGAWIGPNGQSRPPSPQVRTFVVVARDGKWLITQDQNTFVRR